MAVITKWAEKLKAYKQFMDSVPLYFGSSKEISLQWDGSSLVISGDAETVITMPLLPTHDPQVAGQLWNNSGALSISAG